MIDHRRELRGAIDQPQLFVLFEEKPGIGQARAHDPLVAVDDQRRVIDRHVRDDQKARFELAIAIEERKVFLVGAHRQDQTLLGHLQKLVLESADIDRRPFDQRAHFVEQGRDWPLVAKRGTQLAGTIAQQCLDALTPLGQRGDHPTAFGQQSFVVGGIGQFDLRLALEAMPASHAARLQAKGCCRQHRLPMQNHQAMRGAHEAHAGVPISKLVLHELRDRQARNRLLDQRLDRLCERGAGDGAAQVEALLLAVGGACECINLRALFFGPFFQCQRGLTLCVEADGNRWALDFDGAIVGLLAHSRHADCQAPGGGKDLEAAVGGRQTLLAQPVDDGVGKRVAQPGKRLGRELFGEQFDEQRLGHGGPVRQTVCPSARASGIRGARARHGRRWQPRGRAHAPDRCRPRVRSPKSRHAHRAG